MLFADELAMYCYNGGLTDEVGIQRVNRRADEVGKALLLIQLGGETHQGLDSHG